jgi:hypothetical protein
VRLVPLGSGQRCRVVGTSNRPAGAHRRPAARPDAPPAATFTVRSEDLFLGERSTRRMLLAAVLALALALVLVRIVGVVWFRTG